MHHAAPVSETLRRQAQGQQIADDGCLEIGVFKSTNWLKTRHVSSSGYFDVEQVGYYGRTVMPIWWESQFHEEIDWLHVQMIWRGLK